MPLLPCCILWAINYFTGFIFTCTPFPVFWIRGPYFYFFPAPQVRQPALRTGLERRQNILILKNEDPAARDSDNRMKTQRDPAELGWRSGREVGVGWVWGRKAGSIRCSWRDFSSGGNGTGFGAAARWTACEMKGQNECQKQSSLWPKMLQSEVSKLTLLKWMRPRRWERQ